MAYNTLVVMAGAGALGLAAGLVGTFATLRRQALAGDTLAHAALPGLALGFLLAGRNLGALIAAAFGAGLLGLAVATALQRCTRIRQDAALALVLSVFFGAGVALMSYIQRTERAGQAGLEAYLVGSTAGMLAADAWWIAAAALLAVLAVAVSLKEWTLLAFDADYLRAIAGRSAWHEGMFLATLAGVTMIGLQTVGVALAAALLILPGAAARFWTESLRTMLALAAGLGLAIGAGGAWVSATVPGLPAGPVIVLVGAAAFLASLLFAPRRGWLARRRQQARHREAVARRTIIRLLDEDSASAWRRSGWGDRAWRRRLAAVQAEGLASVQGELTDAGRTAAREVAAAERRRRELMELNPELAQWYAEHADLPPRVASPYNVGMQRGLFLVLDGVDGAGKSTQAARLAEWLRARGAEAVLCRDPGTTPAGDAIRSLLLAVKSRLGMPAETLLYLAARAQLLEETVRPAVARGAHVVCDRYQLSTLAYQGHAGGIDLAAIRGAAALATGGLEPDWTGVLDLDPAAAAARRTGPADRIELRGVEYQRRVREGFRREAALSPERVAVLDADAPADVVFARIVREVERVLDAARRA